MKTTILLLAIFLRGCELCPAAQPDFNAYADAIRKSEAVWTYGIKGVRVRNEAEARRVCINTVKHAYRDWDGSGAFVDALASRYCPASADPVGNRNWRRNVQWFLKHP